MKTPVLAVCVALCACGPAFCQNEVVVEVMTETNCSSEPPMGILRFSADTASADSLTATLFRSGYTYLEYHTEDLSFDSTIVAPPGFYQASQTFWVGGAIDTIIYSEITEMPSCQSLWSTLQILGDTNCEDTLAPLGIKAYTDQGMYLNATLYQSGIEYLVLEGVGMIDTIIDVPQDTYDMYVYEYFNGMWDVSISEQVLIQVCFSTGFAEAKPALSADYEVLDFLGRTVSSGVLPDIHVPVDMRGLAMGTYVTRFTREGKFIKTLTTAVVQ